MTLANPTHFCVALFLILDTSSSDLRYSSILTRFAITSPPTIRHLIRFLLNTYPTFEISEESTPVASASSTTSQTSPRQQRLRRLLPSSLLPLDAFRSSESPFPLARHLLLLCTRRGSAENTSSSNKSTLVDTDSQSDPQPVTLRNESDIVAASTPLPPRATATPASDTVNVRSLQLNITETLDCRTAAIAETLSFYHEFLKKTCPLRGIGRVGQCY